MSGALAGWWGFSPEVAPYLNTPASYPRGWLPDAMLVPLLCGAGGLLAWRSAGRADLRPPDWLCLSAARAFFLSLAYLLLRHAPAALGALSGHFDPGGTVDMLAAHFAGESYRLFFLYVADFYLLAGLLLGAGYFFLHRGDPRADGDKYLSFLQSLASLPRLFAGQRPCWSEAARRGALTVALKLFFVPYLTGWTLQNVLHAASLPETAHWDFYTVNQALVDVCILLDTVVFSVGYLLESRRFHSEIRSVDPHLLGWVVCLLCYPPFNQFAFTPFDRPWFDIAVAAGETTRHVFTIAITLLWGVFAWASLALGFKASNLTSRGVVARGPYRFVRHPAYAAKLLIWYMQGVVFGDFSVGLLLALTVIYVLRALTEEWHLMATDPAYEDYRRKVRWRFVPFVV
jgi:protein-S-isoprenylcysteine O-methyltransferase Ste14